MIYNLQDQLSRERFKARVSQLWKNGTIVELTDKKRRSLNQNRYLYVCLGALALEVGESVEFIKQEIFKRKVNPDIFVVEKDDPILGHISALRSSRDLDKEKMSLAIDRFRKFASENGVYIPNPDEQSLIEAMEWEISKAESFF